ncbi:MAG TPA: ribbon-helix-helix domain-containing protein [Xanthobacteraceae bacterium]|nr:ribbon-helix-helix domain-containing protein [Xanthobacteraceae bacterium]
MPSSVIKHSIVIAGHKTSVSLEDCFWRGLKEIARHRDLSLSNLVSVVETGRANANLSSALRVFVFQHFVGGQANGHAQADMRHGAALHP